MRHLQSLTLDLHSAQLANMKSILLALSRTDHETRVQSNVLIDTTGLRGLLTTSIVAIECLIVMMIAWQTSELAFVAVVFALAFVFLAMFRHKFFYKPAEQLRLEQPTLLAPPASSWLDASFCIISRSQPVILPPPR